MRLGKGGGRGQDGKMVRGSFSVRISTDSHGVLPFTGDQGICLGYDPKHSDASEFGMIQF